MGLYAEPKGDKVAWLEENGTRIPRPFTKEAADKLFAELWSERKAVVANINNYAFYASLVCYIPSELSYIIKEDQRPVTFYAVPFDKLNEVCAFDGYVKNTHKDHYQGVLSDAQIQAL